MDKIFEKVYQEKLKDGTVEKYMSDAINKTIQNWMNDYFGWNGAGKKMLEQHLSPLLESAIANSDIGKLGTIINNELNKIYENSAIGSAVKNAKTLNDFINVTKNKKDKLTLTDILNGYAKFIEDQLPKESWPIDVNDLVDDDVEDRTATFEGEVVLEEVTDLFTENLSHSYFRSFDKNRYFKLSFTLEDNEYCDEDTYEDFNYELVFSLSEKYSRKGEYYLTLINDVKLKELPHLPSYILELFNISNNYTTVIIDNTYISKDICVEVEID